MPWFKVDDGFAFHPKVMATGDNAAIGLWARAGSWAAQQLTDGYVPAGMILAFSGTPEQAATLVKAGLWREAPGGYQFHEWEERNPTRAAKEQERKETREKLARWRARKKAEASTSDQQERSRNPVTSTVTPAARNPVTDEGRNPVSNAAPDPTRPDPTPTTNNPAATTSRGRSPRPATPATPEDEIASAVYDHAEGMVEYVAVRGIAKRALKTQGATVPAVSAAMRAVYDAGKPITMQTVGQRLAGKTNGAAADERLPGYWAKEPR